MFSVHVYQVDMTHVLRSVLMILMDGVVSVSNLTKRLLVKQRLRLLQHDFTTHVGLNCIRPSGTKAAAHAV